MSKENLKDQTMKGVGWSAMDNLANQGVSFFVGIILARMLSPKEYGLIGIILIFLAVFNSIVDSGFSNALIRKKNVTEVDYSTGFITNMCVSIVLFALLFITAPWIADFFAEPLLTPLLRVMDSIVIINALAIVQRTILIKQIDFKTQTLVSLISSLVSAFIGITMAYEGFGVWALVGQQVSRQLVNTIFLWVFNRWIPKMKFSRESFSLMWTYGWKLMLSCLIDTVWREIYQVVIGKCYTPTTLGLYTRAQQFGSIFSSNLTGIVQRVSYPVLSNIQDDLPRLKSAYKRIIKITMLVTFVCMLGLSGCAKMIVFVFIGEQWEACVPMLQIICFGMMLYPLHALNLNMLQVQGRSDLFLRLEIIKKVVAVGPLLLGVFVGVYWMLCGSVVTGFFAYYLNAYYSGPYLKYSIKEQIIDIMPSFTMALGMYVILYVMNFLPFSPYIIFPIQLLIGASFIITVCEIRKSEEYIELKMLATATINKIQKHNYS